MPSFRRAFRVFPAHGVLVAWGRYPVPFRLQVIVDRLRPLAEVAQLVESGVDCLQVRIRDASSKVLVEYVREVMHIARVEGAQVHVNCRLDIALATEADGVQLPRHGIQPVEARSIAPELTIGNSVHSLADAKLAARDGASFVTFGHVYPSNSHPGEPGRGLDALESVVRGIAVPVIAIGGIRPGKVAGVLDAGAAGIAVIGSVWDAPDRARAVTQLRKELDR
jgi:thiamine-phosphate pyrophosphorylase